MKNRYLLVVVFSLVAMLAGATLVTVEAEARAGGGKSFGSRGSRSYSQPVSPFSQPRPSQQAAPQPFSPSPYQAPQPAGGGFLRSMAGGLAGGLLGGMLFRSMGFGGGMGGGFGGGIGLFEIILIAGIIYLVYRIVKGRRNEAAPYQSPSAMGGYSEPEAPRPIQSAYADTAGDLAAGLSHIRQMDPGFDEQRFADGVMDIFFKIQGAWMNRDLSSVTPLLTPDMRRIFQEDIDRLLREHRVNRLENIAVRNVEVSEAWQESGQDYITALIYANLLDYTTDDASGQVVEGSKTDPVKFEEFWTFTRPVGNNPWRLSGIDQK
ncbi:Tim44 domain-containing protein [Oryzomonas sagensis]|uniref:Tim44 domain-containing protein n=1 Tax=Oryzomonas sagensis TaxID=2603857 RepID=A0ABQ6TRY1_9BACT|nr:Tim44 domain-containing protein [Oryzomonas sagensis]KAB0671529.1 Tim44 domain-containing protein [Oryzomonas sagensis]